MAKTGNGLAMKASLDIQQAMANARKLNDEYKRLTVTASGISVAPSGNTIQANVAMTRAMRDSLLETERLRQANLNLQNEWQRGAITLNDLNARQRQNTIDRQQATAATRAARQAQQQVNGSYAEAQARLRALGDRIRSVEGGFNNLGRVQQARIAEYRRLNEQLGEFDRRMGNHQRNVGNYQSALQGVKGQLAGLVTTYLSAAAAIGVLGSAFTQALKSDAVRTSLEFTFASVDLADAKLEQLLATANKLGVNYNALTTSYKSFTGAVIASNFDFQQGERIFNAVAAASSRLKLSSEDTEGALRALQQMISKGNVQAEELRGQLGERIPGAFSIAARAMGVTESQLNKMLQKGEVLAADLLPKLATELENTFDTKSEEKVEGLSAAVNRLGNAFSGMVAENSNISTFFTNFINGIEGGATALAKLVNSTSWSEFFARLTTSNGSGDAIRGIKDASEKGLGLLTRVEDIDIEKSNVKTIVTSYEELKIAFENASAAKEEYAKRIADGSLINDGKVTIESLTNTVDRLSSKMNQLKKFVPDITKVAPVKTAAQIAAEERAAKKAIALQEKETRLAASALKSRNDLQSKFDEITKKGVDKQLDADAQELESVKTKYRLLREEAVKFNNDPVNKKRGLKVDASGFARAESNESESVRAKQETDKLKIVLDEQKKLYEDYEFYKEKLGKDAADKKYAAQLNADKNYLKELKRQEAEILDPQKSKGSGGDDLSAIDKAKLKALQERIKIEQSLEDRSDAEKYSKAFQAAMTHSQKLKEIEREYLEQVKDLGEGASKEQINNLKRTADERIKSEQLANADIKNNWAHLFEDFDSMSKGAIIKRLNEAKDGYAKEAAAGVVEAKERIREIDKAIDDLNGNNSFQNIADKFKKWKDAIPGTKGQDDAFSAFADAVSDGARDINQVLGATAQAFGELGIGGEALQATFKNVMGAVDGISGIAKGLATGNPVDIITGSIKLLTSAIELFNTKDRKLQGQIDGYKMQLDALGKAYKQLERDVANAVGNDVYAKQDEQIRGLIQQQQILSQLIDAERAKKKSDQGKIDGWQAQLDAIPNQIEDIRKAIAQSQIQTTFRDLSNSIADALTDAFADPIANVNAFDNAFDKMVVNAVKNSLKLKYLEPVIARFTEDLAAYADANNNSIAGFNFDPWKFIIGQAGDFVTAGLAEIEKFFPALESAVNDGWKSIAGTIVSDLTTVTVEGGVKKMGNSITETISNAILEGFQAQMVAEGLREFYAKIEEFQKGGATITKEQVEALKAEYAVFLTTYNDKLTALEQATGLSFRKLTDSTTEAVVDGLSILGEGISRVLDSGEINAKAFADNFEGFIKNAVLEGLKSDIFADGLKGLNDKIKEFQKDGMPLTREQIAELRTDYGAFTDDVLARLALISEATGIQFDKVIEEQAAALDSGFESLQDSVLGVFASLDGQTIAAGQKFEDVMKQAVLNSFKTQFLAEALKGFYDQLNSFTKDGEVLTSAQISSLRAQYDAMVALGMERMREFERVSGLSFGAPVEVVAADPLESSLAKGIKQITSEQASALEGITRGQYGLQKRMVELLTIQNTLLTGGSKGGSDLFNGARDNFGSVMKIEQNTAATVQRLDLAVAELRAIRQSGGSLRGAGLG